MKSKIKNKTKTRNIVIAILVAVLLIGACLGVVALLHKLNAPKTDIVSPINGVVEHTSETDSGAKISGALYLFEDGTGYLSITNMNTSIDFVSCEIEYTLEDGVITITSAPDSHIKVPATGKVEGRTISITVTNVLNEKETDYDFESTLVKVTTVNASGDNKSATAYYPKDYELDFSDVELKGYNLEKVVVNGEDKKVSYLESITADEDVTIEFIWAKA